MKSVTKPAKNSHPFTVKSQKSFCKKSPGTSVSAVPGGFPLSFFVIQHNFMRPSVSIFLKYPDGIRLSRIVMLCHVDVKNHFRSVLLLVISEQK